MPADRLYVFYVHIGQRRTLTERIIADINYARKIDRRERRAVIEHARRPGALGEHRLRVRSFLADGHVSERDGSKVRTAAERIGIDCLDGCGYDYARDRRVAFERFGGYCGRTPRDVERAAAVVCDQYLIRYIAGRVFFYLIHRAVFYNAASARAYRQRHVGAAALKRSRIVRLDRTERYARKIGTAAERKPRKRDYIRQIDRFERSAARKSARVYGIYRARKRNTVERSTVKEGVFGDRF